ncbi:MAG: hypothetical protein QM715_09080 [Nibricoccus sp.]
MAPRLLTLLSLIETALVNQGSTAVAKPPARSVSFHKAMARMNFSDGSGSIMLQNFTLADGQICVRATFAWAESTASGSHAIYPREKFDWLTAADEIAGAWMAGKPPPAAATTVTETQVDAAIEAGAETVEAAG